MHVVIQYATSRWLCLASRRIRFKDLIQPRALLALR